MAQIFFQANILSDEISFPWIFHCTAPDVNSVQYQETTNVDQSVRLMHNCTSTNQFQPAAFPWQETVICHWKPFFHVSNSLSSFIRRPTVTQCNTEWPEWSKQSLYNTPVTFMAGQLCDTLCVKLCDNMWHCVLQCVTFCVLHSVTFCDTLWQWICVPLVTKVVGNLWHCSPSLLCPSTTVMFNYLMRHNRQRLIWARPTCVVRPVFTDVLWLTGYQ